MTNSAQPSGWNSDWTSFGSTEWQCFSNSLLVLLNKIFLSSRPYLYMKLYKILLGISYNHSQDEWLSLITVAVFSK